MDTAIRGVVQGVTAMISVFQQFVKNNSTSIKGVFDNMKAGIDIAKKAMIGLVSGIGHLLILIGELLMSDAVTKYFMTVGSSLSNLIGVVSEFIGYIAKTILGVVSLESIFNDIKGVVETMLTVYGDLTTKVHAFIVEIITAVQESESFNEYLGMIIPTVIKAAKVIGKIAVAVGRLVGWLLELVQPLLKPMADILGDHLLAAIILVNGALDALESTIDFLLEPMAKIQPIIDDIVGAFDAFKQIIADIDRQINDLVTGAVEKLISVFNRLKDPLTLVKGLIGKVTEKLEEQEFQIIGNSNVPANKEYGKSVKKAGEAAVQWAKDADKSTKALKKQESAADGVTGATGGSGGTGATGGSGGAKPGMDPLTAAISEFTRLGVALASKITGVGGFIAAFSETGGSITAGLIRGFGDILLSNTALNDAFERLNAVIEEVFQPFADALIPILDELIVLLPELVPIIKVLAKILKLAAGSVVMVMRGVGQVINVLKEFAERIGAWIEDVYTKAKEIFETPINNMRQALEKLLAPIDALVASFNRFAEKSAEVTSGGGFVSNVESAGKRAFREIGSVFGMQQGTEALTKDQLLRLPGMEPNAGLIKAHVGEKVGPGGGGTMNVTFNVKALNPNEQVEEIRQLMETLFQTGRLRVS